MLYEVITTHEIESAGQILDLPPARRPAQAAVIHALHPHLIKKPGDSICPPFIQFISPRSGFKHPHILSHPNKGTLIRFFNCMISGRVAFQQIAQRFSSYNFV